MYPPSPKGRKSSFFHKMIDSPQSAALYNTLGYRFGPHPGLQFPVGLYLTVVVLLILASLSAPSSESHSGPLDPHRLTSIQGPVNVQELGHVSWILLHTMVAQYLFRIYSYVSSRMGPVNVQELGHASWILLHTMAAQYPEEPTDGQKELMISFFDTFSRLYPCGNCARHLRTYLEEHPVDVASQEALNAWICRLHNDVNKRLGHPIYECSSLLAEWTPDFSGDCGCSDPVGDEDEDAAAAAEGNPVGGDEEKDGGAVVGAVEPPNVLESKS